MKLGKSRDSGNIGFDRNQVDSALMAYIMFGMGMRVNSSVIIHLVI